LDGRPGPSTHASSQSAEGEALEVATQEAVPALAPQLLFEHAEEKVAFLVRHVAEGVVRIAPREVESQVGIGVIPQARELRVERLAAHDGEGLGSIPSVERLVHAALEVVRQPFVVS